MTGSPAHVHTPTPSGLTQAHQPLRGGNFGGLLPRKCVFEIRDARHQRSFTKSRLVLAPRQLQVSERVAALPE
jgi:hypothetical protein